MILPFGKAEKFLKNLCMLLGYYFYNKTRIIKKISEFAKQSGTKFDLSRKKLEKYDIQKLTQLP